MNIVYLISYAGAGGTEKYVRSLMETFTAQGHRCHLVYAEKGELSQWAEENGFRTKRLDMRPRKSITAAGKLADYCREENIDIIHAQYPRENLIALRAKKLCGSAVVFTGHLTIKQGGAWKTANRLFAVQDDAVIAVSTATAQQMRRNGFPKDKITVIPNGVPVPTIGCAEDAARPCTFISLARFAPEKGLEVLLDACERLKEKSKLPFRCLVYGEGGLLEPIRAAAKARRLEDVYLCPGYTNTPLEALAKADVYVSSAVCNEAMSLAALEAMQLGMPIVMTRVGAGEELAEGVGLSVVAGDEAALCEAMKTLLEDVGLRTELGKKAMERARREYTLTRMAENTCKLYEDVLSFRGK